MRQYFCFYTFSTLIFEQNTSCSMRPNATFSVLLLLFLCLSSATHAQKMGNPSHKPYFSTGGDGYILSTSFLQKPGASTKPTTPRFTALVNIGLNINYDFTKRMGVYAGLNIKNIGFIEKLENPDSTVKRRVYTFGIPVALKIGDVKYGSYFLVGGGVDFPFNYREKGFVKRSDKTKFNEWFSDRTPAAMPYVFVGVHLRPLLAVKVQYYPLNFMNSDYSYRDASGSLQTPYRDYNVQLLMLTAGFDISYRPKN
jgi:hypothetical protein